MLITIIISTDHLAWGPCTLRVDHWLGGVGGQPCYYSLSEDRLVMCQMRFSFERKTLAHSDFPSSDICFTGEVHFISRQVGGVLGFREAAWDTLRLSVERRKAVVGGGSRSSYTEGEYQGKAGSGPHSTYSLTPLS